MKTSGPFWIRWRWGSTFIFCRWKSSFASTVCWTGSFCHTHPPPSMVFFFFYLRWQNLGGHSLAFISVSSVLFHWSSCRLWCHYQAVLSVVVMEYIIGGQVLWHLQLCSYPLGLLWLFMVFCGSKWILGLFPPKLVKYNIRLLIGIALGQFCCRGLLLLCFDVFLNI